MIDNLPPQWRDLIAGLGLPVLFAWLGRLMWHVREVQHARRRFWSLHLVWEVITALAIGFVADGIAAHLGLAGRPATALVIVLSYLGPGGIEALLMRVAARWYGFTGGR